MPHPERIEPEAAHDRVQDDALLVCAYDDDQKCAKVGIPAAMTMTELEDRSGDLHRVQELIFYCN